MKDPIVIEAIIPFAPVFPVALRSIVVSNKVAIAIPETGLFEDPTRPTIFEETVAKKNPNTTIKTSGLDVGLPEGQMGNSEVGHTNIGAGRIVYQELTRITKSIEDGDFFSNPELVGAIERIKDPTDKRKNSIKLSEQAINRKFELSEFEIETFIAFTYFAKIKCDICFIECGMGGELDATNIFTPILSIITSIGLEHTAYLGKTVAEIAYSKAGIIKDEIPVVIGHLNEEAEQAIISVANNRLTKVHKVDEPAGLKTTNEGYNFSYETYQNITINNMAKYIVEDACIALESINYLKEAFPISIDNIRNGFASKTLDARFSILAKDNHVVIDGAHNPEGTFKLAQTINSIYSKNNFHIVFTCFRDKNLERMLANLGEITNDITLTSFPHERCRNEEDYFLFLGEYNYIENPVEAVEKLRNEYPDDYVLVTGSLAFASYMLDLLK